MKVFQYCDDGGLAILRDLELRLSSPNAFNDPFEFSPLMNPADYTKEDGIQTLKQEHMFEEWCRQKSMPCDREAREYYFGHLSEIVDKLMPDLAVRVAREQASFLPRASKVWAVGCFSETCESILMWSHYASQHQGMVIAFNTDREPFNDSERVAILKVQYGQNKIVYKHPLADEAFEKAFHEVAAWKFQDWAYEKEVRILVPRGALRDGRFLKLSPIAIESVTFGCKCPLQLAALVSERLQAPCFKHVKRYYAKQDDNEFKINLKPMAG